MHVSDEYCLAERPERETRNALRGPMLEIQLLLEWLNQKFFEAQNSQRHVH
jgi:hypothetical protein